jgi:hypothetical protein
VDKLTLDGPAPLQTGDGKYPVPQPGMPPPGKTKKQEYYA